MMEHNKDDESVAKNPESKIDYYKLGDAVDALSIAGDKKEKAVAGAKLFGKTLFNVGLFAGKIGAEIIKDLPKHLDNMEKDHLKKIDKSLKSDSDLSDEQRAKLESRRDKMNSRRQERAANKNKDS